MKKPVTKKKASPAKGKALKEKLAKEAKVDAKKFRKMERVKRKRMEKRMRRMARLNAEIAVAEKKASELKKVKADIEFKLVKAFRDSNMKSCKLASGIRAFLRMSRFPTIKNRAKLDRYILKHGALDLLQNRITQKAYFDRLENGDTVPGVEIFERYGITVTMGDKKK